MIEKIEDCQAKCKNIQTPGYSCNNLIYPKMGNLFFFMNAKLRNILIINKKITFFQKNLLWIVYQSLICDS